MKPTAIPPPFHDRLTPGLEWRRWALHAATVAALVALVDFSPASFLQIGLFTFAAALNSEWSRLMLKRHRRWILWSFFSLSLPVFLCLADPLQTGDELFPIRVLYHLLLGAIYLLPFLPLATARDMRRMALVLAACFFISATYLNASAFGTALLVVAFALCLAFNSLHTAPLPLRLRLAGSHWMAAVIGGTLLFLVFPRAWFSSRATTAKYRGKDQISAGLGNMQQAAEAGISARRDILQLPRLLDFRRSGAEVLRLYMSLEPFGDRFMAAKSMYLRAAIFDSYFNGVWLARPAMSLLRDEEDGHRDNWVRLPTPTDRVKGPRIRQRIEQTPLEDICFSLPDPMAIRLNRIHYDGRGVFAFAHKFMRRLHYETISELPVDLNHPGLQALPKQFYPPSFSPYLYIPLALRPIINKLLADWRLEGSPASQVRQLAARLRRQFAYGPVSFTPMDNVDPVLYFLTESKSGYCTHFASSLALLTRAIGLPSRIASGFHFVGPPETDGFYHLYERNAHAWTEVYFPGYGWIVCDATPDVERPSLEKAHESVSWSDAWTRFLNLDDELSGYDAVHQKLAAATLRQFLRTARIWWQFELHSPWLWMGLILIAAGGWAGFRLLPVRHRRRLWRHLSGQSKASSVPFYDDLLWLLTRHVMSKPPGTTGNEYAAAIGRHIALPEIEYLTRKFYQVKYGGLSLSEEELREIEQQLKSVETSLSRQNHNHRPA